MAYPSSANIYQNKNCVRCDLPAVGVVYKDGFPRYYCLPHFNAYKFVIDKQQDERELAQWGDQDWYKEGIGLPTSAQQSLL